MKFLGRVKDPKDLTTKEYVDTNDKKLADSKLNKEDVKSYTAEEVRSLWNQIMLANKK